MEQSLGGGRRGWEEWLWEEETHLFWSQSKRSQGGYSREVSGLPTSECWPHGLYFLHEMTLVHFYHLFTGLFEFFDSAFCSQSLKKPSCPI